MNTDKFEQLSLFQVVGYNNGPNGPECVRYYVLAMNKKEAIREVWKFDLDENQNWAMPTSDFVGVIEQAWCPTHNFGYEERPNLPSEAQLTNLVIGLQTETVPLDPDADYDQRAEQLADWREDARRAFDQSWIEELIPAEEARREQWWKENANRPSG